MKNTCLNLCVALLTLGIGILSGSVWATYNSVDKRFAESLKKFYVKDAEKPRQNISVIFNADMEFKKLEKLLKTNPPKNVSDEKIKQMMANWRQQEAKLQQNPFPAELSKMMSAVGIDERVASDIKSANENCQQHFFTRRLCDHMKEEAIKDIEENMLNQ